MKKTNLKVLALILALLLSVFALAEEPEIPALAFESFAEAYAQHTQEAWKTDETDLILMLSPEEGVSVSVCLSDADIAALTVEFPCGEPSEAVRAALAGLGWLSEEELASVIAMEENSELETELYKAYRVHGDNRDGISLCALPDAERMLWQPMHGGRKLHNRPRCSGMDVSRLITEEAAEKLGWESCGTCRREKKENYAEQKTGPDA